MLGQARETYLIAEGPEGVYLIDQHAAHERVIFEQISDRIAGGKVESQQLLSPETVRMQPGQEEALATHADEVRSIGFVLEDFGSHTVLIRAVPRVLGQKTPSNALIDLLDGVAEGVSASTWQHRLIATLACHSSITAGRTVADEEARALLRQLEQTREPHTCPHGRPTMIHMPAGALDRQFGRS